MNIFEEEFIITEDITSKQLEILIITLDTLNIPSEYVNHEDVRDWPYITKSFHEKWHRTSLHNGRQEVTYKEVMDQLRNEIRKQF